MGGRNLEKIGLNSADTSELFFDNVPVAANEVLGRVGGGFGHLIDELPRERLALAVTAVGHAQGALDLMPCRSEPAPGSDMPMAPMHSPLIIFGRYVFFWNSLPRSRM